MNRIFLLAGLFLCFFFCVNGQNERIVNYEVDIKVNENRSLDITEYIKIYAAGYKFKRGITRNLPTTRILGEHGKQTVFYNIKSIEKDGEKVNYFEERDRNEITVYVGSRDRFIDNGLHEYRINYSVKNQISFFDDFEELYWNAIGTDVSFPIDNANIRITLPEGTEIEETHIYTGGFGQQKEQVGLEVNGNTIVLQSIEKLNSFEGVTASVIVPKGTFQSPNIFQRWLTLGLLIMSLLALLGYFGISWFLYGRDPKSPEIVPIYEAPDGLSPAACAYILKGYVTNKMAVASIVNLVSNGKLKIRELNEGEKLFIGKGQYHLSKLNGKNIRYEEEKDFFHKLFKTKSRHTIKGSYNASLESAMKAHKRSLQDQYRAFLNKGNNSHFNIIPLLWIIFSAILIAVTYYYEPYTEFAKLPVLILYPILSLILLGFYAYLIKKPTVEKVDLKARIKGFKEYLSWTEKDYAEGYDMDIRDIEHFESLLPYAYAFGIADKWQSSFQDLINESLKDDDHYWLYNSPYFYSNFSYAVSSSSMPPAPSGGSGGSGGGFSGGGGGGFSGGGGGGGGVGGW